MLKVFCRFCHSTIRIVFLLLIKIHWITLKPSTTILYYLLKLSSLTQHRTFVYIKYSKLYIQYLSCDVKYPVNI